MHKLHKHFRLCSLVMLVSGLIACSQTATVMPQRVTPTGLQLHDTKVSIEVGAARIVIDGAVGGRVTELSYAEQNVFVKAHEGAMFGATFGASPKSDWSQQLAMVLQSQPYEVRIDGHRAEFRSMLEPGTGLQVVKTFEPTIAKDGFEITYQIHNQSQKAIKVVPWEVSYLHGGVTYFPSGGQSISNNLPIEDSDGVIWYQHMPDTLPEGPKSELKFDGAGGWVANANVETGLLFVKRYPNIDAKKLAPKAGDIELSVNKMSKHLELANQGAYEVLPPGESMSWSVSWYIAPIVSGEVQVKNLVLLEQAQTIVSFDGKL